MSTDSTENIIRTPISTLYFTIYQSHYICRADKKRWLMKQNVTTSSQYTHHFSIPTNCSVSFVYFFFGDVFFATRVIIVLLFIPALSFGRFRIICFLFFLMTKNVFADYLFRHSASSNSIIRHLRTYTMIKIDANVFAYRV